MHCCLWQLYFSVQWKSIFKRIPVSGKEFSGKWERFFLSIFQTFLPMIVFFSSSGNAIFGQWKPIFSNFQLKLFPSSVNLFFNKSFILASGNLCANISNIPFIRSSFSISWKQILNESFITASGNGFSGVFWKPLLQLERGQHLRKSCFCQKKPFSLISDTESFSLASGNRFSIKYELCAFIRSFFLLVDTILEIRCQPIFFLFFYSQQRKQFFWLVETDFFYWILHSGELKRISCLVNV